MNAALPYLFVCFLAQPPAGSHEQCWYTAGQADTLLDWNAEAMPIDSAAQGPGYVQLGYRSGNELVLLAAGNYRWRSYADFPSPRVYVALDDEIVFEPPPDRAADAVFSRWSDWPR